ncbi:hypothetical protein [Gallaecimonas sp. GXIMD4217]|uniref:hypothetical protein n=1 Tax=Gallaecimonas sp. GXIMD4217 TaxID=3131927 RepID=UPI00311AE0CC
MKYAVFMTSLLLHTAAQAAMPATQCRFEQGACVNQGAELVLGKLPLRSQAPISVRLSLPGAKKDKLMALVEGVDMYMGQVPVLLTRTKAGHFQGQFQVASCMHGDMTWQLKVQAAEKEFRFNFVVDSN